ncbi:CPBP family intramembrane glutamic endopeptidase [Synechocystis sp. LEGE 06083]|uniref:CPBP family intramembrane glutamic endopeptidase n=1 Tax=Synechocystis sp. LEGE 06083 TaxID=915336 RepID=UPI001D136775|nr:type II CAAX endopeptidase family protein [Synechocystis sp. LEGE 06083]
MKRIILALLTVISLVPFLLSLVGSLEEPQVQSQLQLSQTNLLLQASAWQGKDESGTWRETLQKALLESQPQQGGLKQYEIAVQELIDHLDRLKTQQTVLEASSNSDPAPIQAVITKNQKTLNQLQINLGLLQYAENQPEQALGTWESVVSNGGQNQQKIATVLIALEQSQPIPPHAEALINDQLKGWFRWQGLTQLYRRQGNIEKPDQICDTPACGALQTEVEKASQRALVKLALLNSLPLLGGGIGVLLIVGLLLQWALGREKAILATNAKTKWDTPWNWETTWQVLVVGFFFPSQIVLPLVVGVLPLPMADLSLMGKAFYVLATYGAIATVGLGVLFLSLKDFRPLPEGWFTLRPNLKAVLWGLGGYLVALPLVVLVSLVNQEIWQGQGGSNPLLSLALDSQNWLVLGIFFFTAAILAPVFEEIIFRGFLLPALTRYFPVSVAIILSSLLFAIAHLNVSEILPLFVLGSVLGLVYSRSRNLLSSMILHSLWNSGTLLSLFILGGG